MMRILNYSAFLKRVGVIACFAVLLSCHDDVIVDDWGPSAGWGRVEGTARSVTGSPIANAEIHVGRCGSPIFGFGGMAVTNALGIFGVWLNLPPIGAYGLPDTGITVECTVIIRGTALEAQVQIPFVRARDKVIPVVINFPQT